MSDEDRIRTAEELLLGWLKESGKAVTTEELDRWRRDSGSVISPLDVHGASWNLVNRGKARFTPDRKLLAV